MCGNNSKLNESHNFVRDLNKIEIEDGHLVVMDENQSVVSWGIPLTNVSEADPIVWQRNNTPPVTWYSEEKTWSELLASMYEWYAETGIWTQAEQTAARDLAKRGGA
jgi:hypothetical protein